MIATTVNGRVNDLVFVTNGIPSDYVARASASTSLSSNSNVDEDGFSRDNDNILDPNVITTSVPHFGVLSVGGHIVSDPSCSPPTIIHGKHAHILSDILSRNGVRNEIVSTVSEVDAAAIRKLLWVSIMWLLCHDVGVNADINTNTTVNNNPITVTQVHEIRSEDISMLVEELLPATNVILAKLDDRYQAEAQCDTNPCLEDSNIHVIGNVEEVALYMQNYSHSMPNAIPNKNLAIDEFAQRNGLLLGASGNINSNGQSFITEGDQPLHINLIKRVVGYIPQYGER